MKIVMPGGSGQVGTVLGRALSEQGHEVVVLSRNPGRAATAPWRVVPWDARNQGEWCAEVDGCDVLINLAGRNVNCRYNEANRRAIMDSRVESTRAIGQAIGAAAEPPRVWLQASTATIYAHRYDAGHDEQSGILGGDEPSAPDTWRFSIDVAKAWEQEANAADTPHTRKVLLRSAMTMSHDRDGVFDVLLSLVRKGLGGTAGDGKQYISWIVDVDFINAVTFLIEHEELSGPVNVCSPYPLPNAEFMRILRETWGTKLGLPASNWMLEIGALFMRTETELVLKSRRVVPGLLLQHGFSFELPHWQDAAADLCRRWRAARSAA